MRKMLSGVAIFAIATLTIQVTSAGAAASPRRVIPTNTAINGRVTDLALGAGRLFIGGQMTAPFNRLGAINPGSGAVVWTPGGVPSEVRALELVGGTLFVGGAFGIRIYNASSLALLRSFSCGSVRALAVDSTGGGVIVGGNISQCDDQTHQNLARIDVGSRTCRGRVHGVDQRHRDRPRIRRQRHVRRRLLRQHQRDQPLPPGQDQRRRRSRHVVRADVRAGVGRARQRQVGPRPSTPATGACSPRGARASTRWSCTTRPRPPSSGSGVPTATPRPCFTQGGNAYFGGHWQTFNGSGPPYFAAVDAGSFAREAVVSPIPIAPMGIFAIIGDGGGGLWLGGDVTGKWGPGAVNVRRLVHLAP